MSGQWLWYPDTIRMFQHGWRTAWISIRKKKIHFSYGGLREKKYECHHYNRWCWSTRLKMESVEGLGDDTARVLLRLQIWLLHWFHLLLLGFGLKLKQQQQIWKKNPQPQVQMQTVHFVSEKVVQPLSEWTSRWAAVPCHFWLPWSGQRWHRLRRSTAHWGAAARREPARPGHNSLSTPAGAPQLGSCGSIWGNMPKVAVKEGETCPFPLRSMLQLGKRQYVRVTVKCAHCWLL